MDNFTQFQMKEYENISQAHFKTNEVLATFYRYFLLITVIPLTTIGIALINFSQGEMSEEGRFIAYCLFGISSVLLSCVGAAVVAYIEGLRLDAILYARVVNSIRKYFFDLPESEKFGDSVLPKDRLKPEYGGFGSGFIIYQACAIMNSTYFAAGVLTFQLNFSVALHHVILSKCQWLIAGVCFLVFMGIQNLIRRQLISRKAQNGF